MSMHPIDLFFDGVEWKPTGAVDDGSGVPFATHEGVAHVGGSALKVFQLSTGQRVIDKDDAERFFGVDRP